MLFSAGRLPTFDHGSLKYDVPATWKLNPSSITSPIASMIARNRAAAVRRLDQRNQPTITRHGKPRYAPFSELLPRNRAEIVSVQCQPAQVSGVGTARFAKSAGNASGEFTPPDWKCRKK